MVTDSFFADSSSPIFIDHIKTIQLEKITLQEDFSLNTTIQDENGDRWYNELMIGFNNNAEIKEPFYKTYFENIKNLNEEITQIVVYAPSNNLDCIFEEVYSKFNLEHEEFYFLKYQHPSSCLRLRFFNTKLSVEDIINYLNKRREAYCISDVVNSSFNEEISTYENTEGLNLYLEISKYFSKTFLYRNQELEGLKTEDSIFFGPITKMLYLALLNNKLYSDYEINISINNFEHDSHFKDYKIIWGFIKKEIKNKDSKLINKINELIEVDYQNIENLLNQWNEGYNTKVFTKDINFFIQRIIHMEIFRLTSAEYQFANRFVLRLATDIEKEKSYSKC